jgi:hypothetical protein
LHNNSIDERVVLVREGMPREHGTREKKAGTDYDTQLIVLHRMVMLFAGRGNGRLIREQERPRKKISQAACLLGSTYI